MAKGSNMKGNYEQRGGVFIALTGLAALAALIAITIGAGGRDPVYETFNGLARKLFGGQ